MNSDYFKNINYKIMEDLIEIMTACSSKLHGEYTLKSKKSKTI